MVALDDMREEGGQTRALFLLNFSAGMLSSCARTAIFTHFRFLEFLEYLVFNFLQKFKFLIFEME